MFGSEYGSPKPSLPVVPTPPVTYIFRVDRVGPHALRRRRSTSSRPVSTPTSASETISDDAVHGVADRFALLEHRLVRLVVPAAVDRVLEAADVEIVLRQIEMLLVVRGAIELHAVDRVALAARERRVVRLKVCRRARRPPRIAWSSRSRCPVELVAGRGDLEVRCCRVSRPAAAAAGRAHPPAPAAAGRGCVFSDRIAASSTFPLRPVASAPPASAPRTGS